MSIYQPRRDTAANWTSEDPTLAAGVIGVETDTDQWKAGDGATAWNSLPYIGGASYTPGLNTAVATNVLALATATVTIALPSGYKGFRIETKVRSNNAAVTDASYIRLNLDSGNNYQRQQFFGNSTSLTASELATPGNSITVAGIPAATAPADYYAHVVVDIPFPDMTTGWKDIIIRSGKAYGTAVSEIDHVFTWGIRRNIEALTSISFHSTTGSFIAGSTFKVMGFK